jgi:triosephosphate isomerase
LLYSGNLVVAATAAAVGAGAAIYYLTTNDIQRARPKGSSVANETPGPRKYLIGGNWKSNGSYEENVARIKVFNQCGPIPDNVEVVLCVPYIHIPMVLAQLRDDIAVGAQDCGVNEKDGAYTGEVSAHMLKDIGCTWVIIGHSERREGFEMAGEPEGLCAKKCKVALEKGLKVMFAIGEKKEERETGVTMEVCAKQLEPLAKLLDLNDWENGKWFEE